MNESFEPVRNTMSGALPACFGKEWSNTEPECVGGPDPAFTDADGRHVHPRCGSFGACGSTTAMGKQPLITPQAMLRAQPSAQQPPVPAFVPQPAVQHPPAGMPPRPSWSPPTMHPPVSPPSVDWRVIEQQRMAGLAARPQYAPGPMYNAPSPAPYAPLAPANYPAQTWQVGNAMPPYLTHEEDRRPGESWFIALFLSLARGMLKAFGHSFARYVDVTPFREPPRS